MFPENVCLDVRKVKVFLNPTPNDQALGGGGGETV